MGKKKKKHTTTKNTMPKPPVTRHSVIEGDCNGHFKIVTDFTTKEELEEFDRIYREWFDSPNTKIWSIESFGFWFKTKFPNRLLLPYDVYIKMTKGKVTTATEEEWKSENN